LIITFKNVIISLASGDFMKINEKRLYECLGVNYFRKYVLCSWEKICKLFNLNLGYRVNDFTMKSIKMYKRQIVSFSIAHLACFLFLTLFGIFKSANIIFWMVNIGLNSYCLMVQRYNYIRINKFIERQQKISDMDICKLTNVCNKEYDKKNKNLNNMYVETSYELRNEKRKMLVRKK